MGVPFASGVRFLLDANQQFMRQGAGPCALRIKNTDETGQEFVEMGFQISASGQQTGFTDVLITPPPTVTDVSYKDIGLSQGKLMFGARKFVISHSFVMQRMRALNITDPFQVFRNTAVIGIAYDGRLFSIEELLHEDAGGEPINWVAIGNGHETGVVSQ